MSARFVNIDHDTPLLLPPDLREWVPRNHLVHFIMDAVGTLDLGSVRVNERGTGSHQYPPATLLGLLLYSYATGVFSGRQIERPTYENVAARLLCADTHPDHDTLCSFRRRNSELVSHSFAAVLEMAARCDVLKVGGITVAIDGTKILATASKHAAVGCERAGEHPRPQRSIQLHRPGKPDHESRQRRAFRAVLQHAGSGGSRKPTDRRRAGKRRAPTTKNNSRRPSKQWPRRRARWGACSPTAAL